MVCPCDKELGSLCIDVNEVCESQVEKKIPRSPTSCDRSVIDKMGEVYQRYYLTPSCEGNIWVLFAGLGSEIA